MRRGWFSMVAFMVITLTMDAIAQEPGIITRKTKIQQSASMKASVVAEVPSGTPVEVLKRSGIWFEVTVKGSSQQGWVRFSRVKMVSRQEESQAAANSGGSSNALADLSRSATGLFGYGGRRATNDGVSTIGIRGLQAEELANARANPAERKKMEANRANEQQATLYAKVVSLRKQEVAYLDGADGEGGGFSLGGFSLPSSSGSSNALTNQKE